MAVGLAGGGGGREVVGRQLSFSAKRECSTAPPPPKLRFFQKPLGIGRGMQMCHKQKSGIFFQKQLLIFRRWTRTCVCSEIDVEFKVAEGKPDFFWHPPPPPSHAAGAGLQGHTRTPPIPRGRFGAGAPVTRRPMAGMPGCRFLGVAGRLWAVASGRSRAEWPVGVCRAVRKCPDFFSLEGQAGFCLTTQHFRGGRV